VTFRVLQAESVNRRQASHFIGCGGLGKAVAREEEWFEEKASKAKSAIARVIDTHVHADRQRVTRRRSSPAVLSWFLGRPRPLRKSADAEKIWAGAHLMNHPVPRSSKRTLLSIIELGGYPNFTPVYQQAGYAVESVASVRKALGLLKKINPDVIVAEFNFQSDFRDRTSSLESLLAVVQRSPNTKVIVFYEKDQAHQLVKLQTQFPIHAALAYPIDTQLLEASLR
jgi:hypothetical protein